MRKVYYIRKSFFESSSKFENRVNSILKDIADNNTIDSVSWYNKAIMVYYEIEKKKPAIKGFSK